MVFLARLAAFENALASCVTIHEAMVFPAIYCQNNPNSAIIFSPWG